MFYLDHNATTPLDEAVLAAMLPFLQARAGNASSRHAYGRAANSALERAREQVAAAVGAQPTEVVFTSGGSEANNLLLRGAAALLPPGLAAVSAIEHPSVLEPARLLAKTGWRIAEIAVDAQGCVDAAAYAQVLNQKPALISVMMANNETGALQAVAELAASARNSGNAHSTRAIFHSDAVQALGKIPINFRALNAQGIHALTLSAHKIGGPQGAAALVLDKRIELQPQIAGGGQERGLRSGTENLAALVGFGVAAEWAASRLQDEALRQRRLRDELEAGLAARGATLFSRQAPRLPNTSYFSLAGLDGETLVGELDRAGFAVAAGAACSSAKAAASHVLLAMGVAPTLARGAVRVSIGRATTQEQLRDFLAALDVTVARLRGLVALAA